MGEDIQKRSQLKSSINYDSEKLKLIRVSADHWLLSKKEFQITSEKDTVSFSNIRFDKPKPYTSIYKLHFKAVKTGDARITLTANDIDKYLTIPIQNTNQ